MMMSYLPLLGLLLIAAISQAQSPFIVGGQDTTIERYPSLVQIEYLRANQGIWDQQCGANILTTYWLLTAAHCLSGSAYDPKNTRIRAGATYRHTGGSVHLMDFERNHPEYGKNAWYDADISVFKIRTPLVYSPTIQKGTIAAKGFVVPDNSPVVYAGWGKIYFGGPSSNVLKEVTVPKVNRDLCAELYGPGVITENMICAGILDVGGQGPCQADSGGPMYAGNVIVGITSFSNRCAIPGYPSVSASVAAFTDWIIENAR